MMQFVYHNPTKLLFGPGKLSELSGELAGVKRVLLVYGGGSIKRSGLYDQVVQLLQDANIEITELAGVEPNPRLSTVHRGVALCREHDVEWVVAVGGGSVVDCAKAIVVGAKYDGDMWDFPTRKAVPQDALPLAVVLTMAATGTEMNGNSVITNWDTQEKLGWGSKLVYPRVSVLDANFTTTLPLEQTVYGMVDIMSHVIENYFHRVPNTPVQDGWSETLLKTVIATAAELIKDLENVELRSTILLCGTLALNGMPSMGVGGDWATHNIEHAVSAVYDIPHGGGLAILFPNWMSHVMPDAVGRFKQFAVNVFDIDPAGRSDEEVAQAGIAALREFWSSIGAPSRLADYEIGNDKLDEMTQKAMKFGPFGCIRKLEFEDVKAIYEASL